VTAFDFKCFADDQRFGYPLACPSQNSAVSLTGHLHQTGGGFLIQTFKIAQPDGFELLNGQRNLAGYGNALRNKGC
jgi:hypothetical protein